MVLSGANAAIFVAELENPYPFDCPIFGVCGENPC